MHRDPRAMLKAVSEKASIVHVWHEQIGQVNIPCNLKSILDLLREVKGEDFRLEHEEKTYILKNNDVKFFLGDAVSYASAFQSTSISVVDNGSGNITIAKSAYPYTHESYLEATILTSSAFYKSIMNILTELCIYDTYTDINIKEFFEKILTVDSNLEEKFTPQSQHKDVGKKGKKQVTGESQRLTVTIRKEAALAAKELASENEQTLGLYLSEVLERDPEVMQKIAEIRRLAVKTKTELKSGQAIKTSDI